jgi:hypothetical protein
LQKSAHPRTFAAGLIIAGQQRPNDLVDLAKQNVLIITGTEDVKVTPWNEKWVPVWEHAGGKVTRPAERLDPALIFPVGDQKMLTDKINGYLGKGATSPSSPLRMSITWGLPENSSTSRRRRIGCSGR